MRQLGLLRHGIALIFQPLRLGQFFAGIELVDQNLISIVSVVTRLHHPHHVVLLGVGLIERRCHQSACLDWHGLGGLKQAQQLRHDHGQHQQPNHKCAYVLEALEAVELPGVHAVHHADFFGGIAVAEHELRAAAGAGVEIG